MTDFVFNNSSVEAIEARERGLRIICHICNEELLIVTSDKDVLKFSKTPGVYCLRDENHVRTSLLINRTRKNASSKINANSLEKQVDKLRFLTTGYHLLINKINWLLKK
jgi:hypothetical protein